MDTSGKRRVIKIGFCGRKPFDSLVYSIVTMLRVGCIKFLEYYYYYCIALPKVRCHIYFLLVRRTEDLIPVADLIYR